MKFMDNKNDKKENSESKPTGTGRTYKLNLTEKVPIKDKVGLSRTYKLDILEKVPIKDTIYRFNIALNKSVAETLKHFSDSGVISLAAKEAHEALTRLRPFIEDAAKALSRLAEMHKLIAPLSIRETSKKIVSEMNSLSVLSFPLEQDRKFTIVRPPSLVEIADYLAKRIEQKLSTLATNNIGKIVEEKVNEKLPSRNYLKSIHLITNSLEPRDVIFLVLDEHYEMPIRCSVNNKVGRPTYIKKLYDIAYIVNVPNKKVDYNRRLADNINNALFRKRQVARYMKTNKLKKPTLVQKSEDGEILVLKNEILIKTGRMEHTVPVQYQSLYIDKTK